MPELLEQAGLFIGVDVGGTKVASGLVDTQGKILFQTRIPMVAGSTSSEGLSAVTTAINAASAHAKVLSGPPRQIQPIGICAPGPLDPKAGVILNPPNLPCWRNYPLAAEVARVYGVRVKVENDANAAGLAEALWGAGRGYSNIFYATIGTGIGTAILIDGRILHGRTGAAGEGGHMSIDYQGPLCGCGKPGCIEVLAAGPAIARRARAKLKDNPHSMLLQLANGKIENVTGEMVGEAYAAGDVVATETLRETVSLLTLWLGNIIDLLEPEIIIMGGGVASMLQPLFREITAQLLSCCVNQRCREIPLVSAHYGADSGIAGGAALCMQSTAAVEPVVLASGS